MIGLFLCFTVKNSCNLKPYWQDPSFPTMQPVFSSFFKEDLRELPNNK